MKTEIVEREMDNKSDDQITKGPSGDLLEMLSLTAKDAARGLRR